MVAATIYGGFFILKNMATDKKGFILYADQHNLFKKLPNEKAGELIKHIFSYVNDENPEAEDLLVEIAFEPIKMQLKRDLEKFQESKAQRSEAGKRSAALRKIQRDATVVDSVENISTNPTVIDKVKVKVNVKDKVKVKVISIEERKSEFINSLHPFISDNSSTLLKDFAGYWTEHGLKDKKMRFEKQTSFDINRRLATWKRNETKFGTAEDKKDKTKQTFINLQNKLNNSDQWN